MYNIPNHSTGQNTPLHGTDTLGYVEGTRDPSFDLWSSLPMEGPGIWRCLAKPKTSEPFGSERPTRTPNRTVTPGGHVPCTVPAHRSVPRLANLPVCMGNAVLSQATPVVGEGPRRRDQAMVRKRQMSRFYLIQATVGSTGGKRVVNEIPCLCCLHPLNPASYCHWSQQIMICDR